MQTRRYSNSLASLGRLPAKGEEMIDVIKFKIDVLPIKDEYSGSLDHQTRLLRKELGDIGVAVTEIDALAPTGAKSAEAFALGSFALAVLPKLLPALIQSISEWLSAREKRKIRLHLPDGTELELTGPVATNEIIRLVDASKATVQRKD
jgi:hypothetical protein